jgi:hypothetical protein
VVGRVVGGQVGADVPVRAAPARRVDVVSFFVTAREASQPDSHACITARIEQLSQQLGDDCTRQLVEHVRDGGLGGSTCTDIVRTLLRSGKVGCIHVYQD